MLSIRTILVGIYTFIFNKGFVHLGSTHVILACSAWQTYTGTLTRPSSGLLEQYINTCTSNLSSGIYDYWKTFGMFAT